MKILSSARIAVLDADPARRAGLCAALAALDMRHLIPLGSLDEARVLAAREPVDVCVVNASGPAGGSGLAVPAYPFDPARTPGILIAVGAGRDVRRDALAAGYGIVLTSPAPPRVVYRRIGALLQKARRTRRRQRAASLRLAPPALAAGLGDT